MRPLERSQQDLARIRTLGPLAGQIDAIFHHRIERRVRRDATVSYQGQRFEVPYELSGRTVRLVVDPHRGQVLGVEDAKGRSLGAATPLDAQANLDRPRVRAQTPQPDGPGAPAPSTGPSLVDLALQHYYYPGQREDL
jgi:putative transposase